MKLGRRSNLNPIMAYSNLTILPDPLTPEQAAAATGVAVATIYNWIKAEKLQVGNNRPFRISKRDLISTVALESINDGRITWPDGYHYIHDPAYFAPIGGVHIETNEAGEVCAVWIGSPDAKARRLEVLSRDNPLQKPYGDREPVEGGAQR